MPLDDYNFWTAAGTVAAVLVALVVALTQAGVGLYRAKKQRELDRRKTASLVSAWVEHRYDPDPKGEYYRRTVTLHLANESDEPVYKVEVLCGIGTEKGVIQVGPLAAPRIIPVLPPKREFTYDVTMGMLAFGQYAHDAFQGLLASVEFLDHEGTRWARDFSGDLSCVNGKRDTEPHEVGDELTLAQAGPTDNAYNPLVTVLAFSNAAADDKISDDDFRMLLSKQASGWNNTPLATITELRNLLRDPNLATHVWYITPRIAFARLLSSGEGEYARAKVLTLVWRNGIGWMFFGVGRYLPWDIRFNSDELHTDPLDGRK